MLGFKHKNQYNQNATSSSSYCYDSSVNGVGAYGSSSGNQLRRGQENVDRSSGEYDGGLGVSNKWRYGSEASFS